MGGRREEGNLQIKTVLGVLQVSAKAFCDERNCNNKNA
jgi:hypothetical protein